MAKNLLLSGLLAAFLSACTQPQKSTSVAAPTPLRIVSALAVFPTELPLLAGSAPHRLAVTGADKAGFEVPAPAKFTSDNPAVAKVSPEGKVQPLAAGSATVTASFGGKSATVKVTVLPAPEGQQVSFVNDVLPILSKAGCNLGSCHAKSDGQNGFKLTIFAFDPRADYFSIIKGARGRRVFPAFPEESLLLKKAVLAVPHDGGLRLERESEDYRTLVNWIAQGMPYGNEKDPVVTKVEVFPKERTLQPNSEQQLKVIARYSDGHFEDVTRGALFEANDKDMATAEPTGLVKLASQPGDVGIMVRYQSKVAVFRATVPLGAPVQHLPVAKNFIDESVFKKLKRIGLPPSEVCDDATFIRRVTLDLAGRLPSADETTAFLADKSAAKRDVLVDRLLASGDYADYFANYWSALLRNQRSSVNGRTEPYMRGTFAFHDWIRDGLANNKPYDQFAREILAASGDIGQNPPVAWYRQVKTPQNQLEDTAQLFLGLRLQCAQCHHHPYEKWSQADYYSFGAFFSQVSRKPSAQPGEELIFTKRSAPTMANKKNNIALKPAGLGETPLDIPADEDARQSLADWLSKKDNTFFAHSLVNRYWKLFFNRGLVEPEDDMRETNPPVNPELLDALAKSFIESGFDLKKLVRTIVTSSTYQLSAIPNSHNAGDKQNFSRYYPKRLSAEVLFDAINTVTKSEANWANLPAGTRAVQLPDN
ncbi:MAG: DUF1549 domain-containing protein, partial [Verrucomicrobia bacterium]|nr:DUF1549 domain-containing protein [Verrucomicrobiota bacterium]